MPFLLQKTKPPKGYVFPNDHFDASADADGSDNTDKRITITKRLIKMAVSPRFTRPSNLLQDFYPST